MAAPQLTVFEDFHTYTSQSDLALRQRSTTALHGHIWAPPRCTMPCRLWETSIDMPQLSQATSLDIAWHDTTEAKAHLVLNMTVAGLMSVSADCPSDGTASCLGKAAM